MKKTALLFQSSYCTGIVSSFTMRVLMLCSFVIWEIVPIYGSCSALWRCWPLSATHVLEVRAPHLSIMLLKEYWFRELFLGLKVTASFDRHESNLRAGEMHHSRNQATEPAGHLERQFITVFVPAWMIPPVHHSLRRESIKNASSASAIGPVGPPYLV